MGVFVCGGGHLPTEREISTLESKGKIRERKIQVREDLESYIKHFRR